MLFLNVCLEDMGDQIVSVTPAEWTLISQGVTLVFDEMAAQVVSSLRGVITQHTSVLHFCMDCGKMALHITTICEQFTTKLAG